MKTYGYVRVSTKEQNEERQKVQLEEKGCNVILVDKTSGKNIDRPNYQLLKQVVDSGDKVIFTELDRLGRNYDEIKEEIRYFDRLGVDIDFLDFPMPTTNDPLITKMLRDQIINTLAYVAQKELEKNKTRREQGINAMPVCKVTGKRFSSKTGKHTGRPSTPITTEFIAAYNEWKLGLTSGVKAMEKLNMSKATFYRMVKKHEKDLVSNT